MSPALVNWAIVIVYFAVTLWIGGRVRGSQRTLDDYLLAGRRIPWWAASLSIVATETSTLTFVGVPAIAYAGDLKFLQVAIGYVFGRAIVAVLLVPGYFRGSVSTAYEVLARRFGGRVQTLASTVFVVSRCLADGVRLYATALVLLALLPMPLWTAIALVAGVTLYYTLRGGLRAVIWNDVIQQIVYVGGAGIAALVLLRRLPGGWDGALTLLRPEQKLAWLDFAIDPSVPYTFWAGVIGGGVLTMATHGTDQMFVQRLLACGERRKAQAAVVGSGVVVCAQMGFFLWVGALLYAFYEAFPPARAFAAADEVFPRFIAQELPTGLGGLVIAAVFAAAMSTLSSSLNSLASASTIDLWRRWRHHAAGDAPLARAAVTERSRMTGGETTGGEDEQALRRSHSFTAIGAVVLALVAFLAQAWGSVLEAGLTITSITFGGVLGIFVVGQTRWQLPEGRATLALVLGIVAMVGVHLTGAVAWTWYTLIGAAVTVIAAGLGSTAWSE